MTFGANANSARDFVRKLEEKEEVHQKYLRLVVVERLKRSNEFIIISENHNMFLSDVLVKCGQRHYGTRRTRRLGQISSIFWYKI